MGGPNRQDQWADDRTNYAVRSDHFMKFNHQSFFKTNEVTTDYNAGFQSAVAGLRTLVVDGVLQMCNE